MPATHEHLPTKLASQRRKGQSLPTKPWTTCSAFARPLCRATSLMLNGRPRLCRYLEYPSRGAYLKCATWRRVNRTDRSGSSRRHETSPFEKQNDTCLVLEEDSGLWLPNTFRSSARLMHTPEWFSRNSSRRPTPEVELSIASPPTPQTIG